MKKRERKSIHDKPVYEEYSTDEEYKKDDDDDYKEKVEKRKKKKKDSNKKVEKKKKGRPPIERPDGMCCVICRTQNTPMWRFKTKENGDKHPYCNRCGLRVNKDFQSKSKTRESFSVNSILN